MKKCMSVTLYIPCLSAAATGGIDNGECNRPWPDACWPWPNDLGKDTAGNCWSLNKKNKNFINQILFNIFFYDQMSEICLLEEYYLYSQKFPN